MTQPVHATTADVLPAGDVGTGGRSVVRSKDRGPWCWRGLITGLFCSALSVATASLFLRHQSLWLDEIGQLGGLTLGPLDVVSWLAGRTRHDLLVPRDTMPPLSYWVGWLWSGVFGLGEIQLRWLGVTCVGLAALLVSWAAQEAWGLASGVAAGLLFALSPEVIVNGVAIRAYPLFLLASAATLLCFTRLLADPIKDRPGWLVGIAVCGILANYTHFFGLVLIGSCLLATLIIIASRGGKIGPILMVVALVGVVSLGIMPFVTASIKIYSSLVPAVSEVSGITWATSLVKLLFHLFAGPSVSLSPLAIAAAVTGAAIASASSLAPKRRSNAASMGLLLALSAGLLVVSCARFVLPTLNTLPSRYNLWMVPASILLLSSGLASEMKALRLLSLVGIVLLVAGNAYGASRLAVLGDYFANSPGRQIVATIRSLGVDQVAVIHDESHSDPFKGYDVYIALRYRFGSDIRQYAYKDADSDVIRVVDLPERRVEADPTLLSPAYLLVLNSARLQTEAIVEHLRRGTAPVASGPVARSLAASLRWTIVEDKLLVAYLGARATLFKRKRHQVGEDAEHGAGSVDGQSVKATRTSSTPGSDAQKE